MKESDKGLVAVVVFVAIFYLSKRGKYKAQSQYDLQRAGATPQYTEGKTGTNYKD